jgi:hypothetical protein
LLTETNTFIEKKSMKAFVAAVRIRLQREGNARSVFKNGYFTICVDFVT